MTAGPIADDGRLERPLAGLIAEYGAGEHGYLAVAVVGKALATFLSYADVFVIGLAFDAIFNDEPLRVPLLPDSLLPADPYGVLYVTAGLLVALKAVDIGGTLVSEYGAGVYAHRVIHRLRRDLFDATLRHDLGYFDTHRAGDVMSVLNDDVNTLEKFLVGGAGWGVWILTTLVSSVAFMAVLNWQLTLLVLTAAPVLALVNKRFSDVVEERQDEVRPTLGALNARLKTALGGIAVVKAFTAEQFERSRIETASREHTDARWGSRRATVVQEPVNRLIAGAWLLLVLLVGSYWILVEAPGPLTGSLTVGQLVPFLFYMRRVSTPMASIGVLIERHKAAKAAAKRIDGLRSADRAVVPGEDCQDGSIRGRVEYDEVTFRYPGADRPALQDVSAAVEPGQTVGIVGQTGAGKSTFVKLLLRFYDADHGAVRIDGRDVRELSLASLRESIGYVGQEPFLFEGTVRENIAYGGTVDDVEQAARDAGAHEFVSQLPDGYDTEVGEGGSRLSGGQRQRIALARAVAGDPAVLLLDEATSHVDTETEALLLDRLDDVSDGRTTFVVAHRLSTIRSADRILVFQDGRIEASGTHEELLETCETYERLWNVQVGSVSDVAGRVRQ